MSSCPNKGRKKIDTKKLRAKIRETVSKIKENHTLRLYAMGPHEVFALPMKEQRKLYGLLKVEDKI